MAAALETSFSPSERIRFLSDVWASVRVGRLNIAEYLATIEQMQSDRNRDVVSVMLGHIPEIHDRIVDPADRPAVEAWTREFLRPIAADLGESPVPGESAERAALRSDVFGTLAAYGNDPDLLAKALAVAEAYMKAPDTIDAALAQDALSIAARSGDTPLYDAYMAHLSTAKTPAEYYAYLGALTQFPIPALTKRTVEFS